MEGGPGSNRDLLDLERLRVLVNDRLALGAVAFTARAGRWVATLDRTPVAYGDKLEYRKAAFSRAKQYIDEGMTSFRAIEGPWTVYHAEEENDA